MRYFGNKRIRGNTKLSDIRIKNSKYLSDNVQEIESNRPCVASSFDSRKRGKRIVSFALLTAIGLMFYAAFDAGAIKRQEESVKMQTGFYHRTVIVKPTGEKNVFDTQIADTPQKSMKGLMFYKSLPENQGMLFIAPNDQVWTMWMKNTYIPLDMIYFKRNGEIVKIIKNARPHDLTHLSSDIPVAGVLEIGGGLADKFNIAVGDILLNENINK